MSYGQAAFSGAVWKAYGSSCPFPGPPSSVQMEPQSWVLSGKKCWGPAEILQSDSSLYRCPLTTRTAQVPHATSVSLMGGHAMHLSHNLSSTANGPENKLERPETAWHSFHLWAVTGGLRGLCCVILGFRF